MKTIIFILFIGVISFFVNVYQVKINKLHDKYVNNFVATLFFALPAIVFLVSFSEMIPLGIFSFFAMFLIWWISGKREAVYFSILLTTLIIAVSVGIFE
jgi:hypothetical protein